MALSLVAASACYSGLPLDGHGAGAGPAPGSGGSDGADEPGSGSSGGVDELDCAEPQAGRTPLRRLTRSHYANVVTDLFGIDIDPASLDTDEKNGVFDANTSTAASLTTITRYQLTAESVAAEAAATTLTSFLPCAATIAAGDATAEAACRLTLLETIGRRAFRRSLTQDEISAYTELAATGADFVDGVRLVIEAMLQSPYVLYLVESPPADGEIQMVEPLELAARLSFFLWESVPDDALLDAAESGALLDRDELLAQATRMLDDPRAERAVVRFHLQWLGLDGDTAPKDEALYPTYSPALLDAMRAESARFVSHVVLRGEGTIEELLTADYTFLEGDLFAVYGITPPPDHDPSEPIYLDPSQRAGLLTQPSFLAIHAIRDASSPIKRGKFVREAVLCDVLGPPPDLVPELPPFDPDATTRERYEQHKQPACDGCHMFIDGIGFGFEQFDAIGAFRTTENGKPVDASGDLVDQQTLAHREFDGAVELAALLGQSDQVKECVANQWFRFALGRPQVDRDQCTLDAIQSTILASDGDIRSLLLDMIASDSFYLKSGKDY